MMRWSSEGRTSTDIVASTGAQRDRGAGGTFGAFTQIFP